MSINIEIDGLTVKNAKAAVAIERDDVTCTLKNGHFEDVTTGVSVSSPRAPETLKSIATGVASAAIASALGW